MDFQIVFCHIQGGIIVSKNWYAPFKLYFPVKAWNKTRLYKKWFASGHMRNIEIHEQTMKTYVSHENIETVSIFIFPFSRINYDITLVIPPKYYLSLYSEHLHFNLVNLKPRR